MRKDEQGTKDLIRALVADAATGPSLKKLLYLALLAGTAASACLFVAAVGVRDDFAQSLSSIRFLFKFVILAAAIVPAVRLLDGSLRPGGMVSLTQSGITISPLLAATSVALELIGSPASNWISRLIGQNIGNCLTLIPLLSIPILVSLLGMASRWGAPEHPVRAGAYAGLAASSLAAFMYASNCSDDSPLFVVTWYPIAMSIVVLAGAGLGSRFARW